MESASWGECTQELSQGGKNKAYVIPNEVECICPVCGKKEKQNYILTGDDIEMCERRKRDCFSIFTFEVGPYKKTCPICKQLSESYYHCRFCNTPHLNDGLCVTEVYPTDGSCSFCTDIKYSSNQERNNKIEDFKRSKESIKSAMRYANIKDADIEQKLNLLTVTYEEKVNEIFKVARDECRARLIRHLKAIEYPVPVEEALKKILV